MPTTPQSLFEKVWNAHAVKALENGQTQLFIGTHLIHEVTSPQAFGMLRDLNLRVRHPLVRSSVYQAATTQQRRQVHAALAQVLGEIGDGDRQAWHLAAAAEGPDEDVVQALERTAVRAERRGGYVAAAAAHERAAELTADENQRAASLFAA